MGYMGRSLGRQIVMLGLIVALVMAALPAPASAGHSWGSYHWGRTSNPFTVQLGNNLSGTWGGYLSTASVDWSASSVLDTAVVGAGGCANPVSGYVQVCNADYGATGWLGIAQIWIGGGHIVQGMAKMNDYYFNQAPYNSDAWRLFVMCQEVGHTFGLGHTDETHANANQGTCMDYTNDPDGGAGGASETDANNMHPNKHDYDQLSKIYRHKDRTTTVANASSAAEAGLSRASVAIPSGPEQGGVSVFVTPVEGGEVVTFVIWADANLIGAANANDNAPIANDSGETVVEEGYPADEGEHDHEAQSVDTDGDGLTDVQEAELGTDAANPDTDGDGLSDGDEVAAGTNPLTVEQSTGNVETGESDSSASSAAFTVGSTVITTEAVNLRVSPSRQADPVTELAAGTVATVTGPTEQGEGLNWVPVTVETPDGTLAGYVAADFITPA